MRSSKEHIDVLLALLKLKKCKRDHLFDEQSFKSHSFKHFYRKMDAKQQYILFMIFLFFCVLTLLRVQ